MFGGTILGSPVFGNSHIVAASTQPEVMMRRTVRLGISATQDNSLEIVSTCRFMGSYNSRHPHQPRNAALLNSAY